MRWRNWILQIHCSFCNFANLCDSSKHKKYTKTNGGYLYAIYGWILTKTRVYKFLARSIHYQLVCALNQWLIQYPITTGPKTILLPSLQARSSASSKGRPQDRASHQGEASHRQEEGPNLVSVQFSLLAKSVNLVFSCRERESDREKCPNHHDDSAKTRLVSLIIGCCLFLFHFTKTEISIWSLFTSFRLARLGQLISARFRERSIIESCSNSISCVLFLFPFVCS